MAWYNKNRVRARALGAAAARIRYQKLKDEPWFKVKRALRNQIKRICIKSKTRKNRRTEEYAGCTITFLRKHIESQFKDGMTWDNYATMWEVDHIRPLCTFDLTNEQDRLKANHYTNLRPLCKHLNRLTWRAERDKYNNHYDKASRTLCILN